MSEPEEERGIIEKGKTEERKTLENKKEYGMLVCKSRNNEANRMIDKDFRPECKYRCTMGIKLVSTCSLDLARCADTSGSFGSPTAA